MNKEDKELQKHLIDEMMKVYKTNPDVMIYMEALMKKYEEKEQEIDKLNNDIKTLLKENERLKNDVEDISCSHFILFKSYKDYKSRIEKAVEYIKTKGLKEEEWQNGFCIKATATYTREEIFDLLNILQNGSDDNEKD